MNVNVYKIKNIVGNKDTYIVTIDENANILSIENVRTKAFKTWKVDVDNRSDLRHSYIYKFLKTKVKTCGFNELNKFFKELESDDFWICRFNSVVENFGL